MPKSQSDILEDAKNFYVSKGYGNLLDPINGESLANDKSFSTFYIKYEKAFKYYEGNYPDGVIQGHLGGIDFNGPVELVKIPIGQRHTQTQVAWGPKGNYYSTSQNTPEMMGIAPKGKIFDPNFVPGYLQKSHDEKIEQMKIKMMNSLFQGQSYDKVFPTLPQKKGKGAQSTPPTPSIVEKSLRTYESNEEVTALKSTSKEINDTWSVPNQTIHCQGGGLQLYVSHSENMKMKQVEYGKHDNPEQVTFKSLK